VKAVYILPIQVTGMQQFISVAKMAKKPPFWAVFCEQSIEEN